MGGGKDFTRQGEGKNSWLTGTAAWSFVALSQHLLGIRPDFDGLQVHPVIGKEIPSFTAWRKCRGAQYEIRVRNAGGGERAPKLSVDGRAIEGDLVPYAPRGARAVVDCEV